jgi:hypothetical protein
MPSFKLNDRFGASIDVAPDAASAIGRYFRQLPEIVANGFDWTRLAGTTLADPALTSIDAGLTFAHPVPVAAAGAEWNVSAGLSGSVRVVAPGGPPLLGKDVFADEVAVQEGERYVAVALRGEAGASVSGGAGSAGFGFEPGVSFTVANYRRFAVAAEAPPVIAALRSTFESLSIPYDAEDLRALPEDGIVALEGRGSLEISGKANLLAVANPLASVDLPGPLPDLRIKSGGSVQVGARYRLSGEYRISVQRLPGNRVRLGCYRKRGSEFAVTAEASAGLSAAAGDRELFPVLLGAIGGDAAAERNEFQQAGAPDAQVAAIEGAVKAGIQRKLEVALSAELSRLSSDGAAFLFEIELDRLDEAGREAVKSALGGDLSGMAGGAPAGIAELRNAFTSLRERTHTFKINLLGIYNAISISKLALAGSVFYEPVTGDLAITDSATAQRIRAATVNFGADSRKLRKVLAESFLITAAYRGSRSMPTAPTLKTSHSYFELHDRTDRRNMREHLDVAAALGFLAAEDAARLLGGDEQFGRTTLYAEMSCDDSLAAALFLEDEQPRTVAQYEKAGREAILLLVPEGDAHDYRRRPAADDLLWERMKSAGQFNFRPLFPRLQELQVQVIAVDYTTIRWWADTMRKTALELARMRAFLAANPDVLWTDPRFRSLREDFSRRLGDVARNTREEFGQPWGLIAMDRLLSGAADARVQIGGGRISLSRERARALGAGG